MPCYSYLDLAATLQNACGVAVLSTTSCPSYLLWSRCVQVPYPRLGEVCTKVTIEAFRDPCVITVFRIGLLVTSTPSAEQGDEPGSS